MRIPRRDLLQQLGTAAVTTGFFRSPGEWPFLPTPAAPAARLVRLNRNESAYGPCEKAKVAFHEAFVEAKRYPGEDVENLRAAIAASQGVQPENITLGCGSTEIFRMAAEAFLGSDKTLVMASPTLDFIARAARLLGAKVRPMPLTSDYGHDLDAMLAGTDAATGLIYICNPNNPTGTLTPKSDLEAFLPRVAPSTSVLIDEAYHDYVSPTGAYVSLAARAAVDPRLIVTRTFSKIYGLAGLRVGYAVSHAETAKRLSARSLPMDISVVAARAALAALADQAYVKRVATLNGNDRQEFFNQANARMLRCLDSQTNFVLFRVGRSGKEVEELLRTKGVLIAADYPFFERYIRVSLGAAEDMQAFWRAWDALMPHHPM